MTTSTSHHDHWHPTWYKPEHATQWDRVREAVRRDWQQTKHDLNLGGHELNQRIGDTTRQASGAADVPSLNDPNPPRVLGDLPPEWDAVAKSIEYGYAARKQFGATHAEWNDGLERDLRIEWESGPRTGKEPGLWDDIKAYVRYGYDAGK